MSGEDGRSKGVRNQEITWFSLVEDFACPFVATSILPPLHNDQLMN